MTYVLVCLLGLAIGLVMGLLGGGGAILAVPVCVYLLGMTPHSATASSLVVVGLGALAGALRSARGGNVAWAEGVVVALLGIAGSSLGTWLSGRVSGDVLMGSFAVLLVVVAASMWWRMRSSTNVEPTPVAWHRPKPLALLVAVASLVGLLTGFFGVGGGFLIVPALTLGLGFGMHKAIGTSLLVITLNCVVALAPRLSSTHIDWHLTMWLAGSVIVGSLAGTTVGARVKSNVLRIGFIALLLAVSSYTLARVFL